MDEYNLAEAFLDPTEVQRHVVDIGDFQKIPFAELAGLGGLIAELIPQFRTVTETINIPMEGLFRAINPKTGEVMPDLMYKSKQVAEAFVGSLKHANGEFDQAAFVKVPGVKEVTTSVAAINPATLMIAAGIMAMSKKLDNIQEGQKNIMGFLEKDKESKLKGDLTFLLDVFKKYRLNWSNSTFRNTQYNKTQDIEQEAEHNIDFYRSMLSGELKKKKFLVSKLDVKKNMQKLIENFSNYRLAIYIYGLLEGASRALCVERDDLSGCLKWFFNEETKQPNYGFVFYDKTPGGAGHVRRMADPEILKAVFEASLTQMLGCTCGGESMDTSCYSCLRNYYNQKYHDLLQRGYTHRRKRWPAYVLQSRHRRADPQMPEVG